MPSSRRMHPEIRAALRKRKMRTLALALALGLVFSAIMALMVYGLYSVKKF